MAKNLNQFNLKDPGGTGNAGESINRKKSGRKENLPDLTTDFADALTNGVNSLLKKATSVPTDNSATRSLVGSKASSVIQNYARKQQDVGSRTKAALPRVKKGLEDLDKKLGDTPSVALSSLTGTPTTPNQNREAYDKQNRHGGNIVTLTRSKREAEKAGRWDFISYLDKKAGEVPNAAVSSLVGSNAPAEDIQAATERTTRPVTQLTEWVTGNDIADLLINPSEKAAEHRLKSEQLQQEAYDKYGQYETGAGQYIDEVVSSAANNAIRWGKRAALMALGVPMELLNAGSDLGMFMSAAGDAVREAEETGATDTQTALHALLSGAAEAGFEHLTDPLNIAGYSFGIDNAVDKAIMGANLKPAGKFLLNIAAHGGLEGAEELFTTLTQDLSKKYALNQDISGKEIATDALKADLMGTLSALLLVGLGGGANYSQYEEDLAMYYWNMSEEQKLDVAEELGKAFGKDPALIRRSMDDRAFDKIEKMDGHTLMRAIKKAPVYIDPVTNASVYELTKYNKDQQTAQDFANRLGVKMNAVEDIEALTDENGAKYINDGMVTHDDTILISAASETPIQDTLFHEVVHEGRDTPEGQDFIKFAQEIELAERGEEGYQEYYNGVADVYKNAYDPNSAAFDSKVKEEIAAKFTKRLAADPETMERIYRRNGNMFQRIYQGIRDAVSSFDNTDDLTDEQKTLKKTEKLYSDMLKRMRRDALLDGMGLGDGEVLNMQTIKDNTKELVNRGERGEPMTNAGQVAYSLTMDKDLMQRAKEVNRESKFVAEDVMEIAEQQRLAVQSLMSRPKVLAVLPADDTTTNGRANTKMKNGSYGISEENTTVCVRMMSNEYVLDRIAERIGRPLNVSESLKISQMFMQWAAKAQCLYCYEGMDRWAKREFHNRWFDARDYVVGRLQDGEDYNQVYEDYLEKFLGRKPNQKNGATDKRMQMWQRIANGDVEAMPRSALASVAARDQAWTEHPEWREQLRNADGYAQSASYAKKNIAYTAYDGHILKWSDTFIKQLNSDFGMRMYSFSDFSKAFILENMQMVTDAAVKGLKGLSYTKEADFVKIFAPTGMLINCSIFGMTDRNGAVSEDAMQGMKWNEAKALRDQYPNVGVIFVATNDQQVEWGLDQDWVDVVIPFHTVKTGEQIAAALNFTNYKGMQEDRKLPGWDKTNNVKSISPAMHNNDLDTYLRLCEENNLAPRFPEWMNHPNYMKLVVETRMPYNEAQPMQPTFDISEVESMLNDFVRRGGFENEGYGSVKIPLAEVSNRLADAFVKDGGATYTAGDFSRENTRRSLTPADFDNYMDAVNRGDMETADRLRRRWADERGYTRESYHGTMNGGFTQFDRQYANPEGNSGAGFYSTTDYDDADSHYRDAEGADNFFKRSSLADQIMESGEWDGEPIDDYDEAYRIATEELNANPQLYELRFRTENPYTRNFNDSDNISLYDDAVEYAEENVQRDEYYDEDDYNDDYNQYLSDYLFENIDSAVRNAITDIDNNYEVIDDIRPKDIDNLVNAIFNVTYDYGGLNYDDIESAVLNNAENYSVLRPNGTNAEFAGAELTRAIIENLGYDAIIDKEVDRKFNQVKAMPGTEHYIAFNPSQYKLNDTVTYDDQGNVIPLSQRDNPDDPDIRRSLRTADPPKKTKTAYKLMRLMNGKLYPLFIGNNEAIEVGQWYDAESPNLENLKNLAPGTHLLNMRTGEAISWDDYKNRISPEENGKPNRKTPNVKDIHWANDNGYRFMEIVDKSGSSSAKTLQQKYGDPRAYYNWGVNGSSNSKTGEGSPSKYALRPGWHFGEVPSMRQIGYKGDSGENDMRLDNQVWVEVAMAADKDYNDEARSNASGDIPTHIPVDGYYQYATNPTQKKSKGGNTANDLTKGNWYVAGSFMPVRILSDSEADAIVNDYNMRNGTNIPLDYRRAGNRMFNAETMQVEDAPQNYVASNSTVNNNILTEGGERYDQGRMGTVPEGTSSVYGRDGRYNGNGNINTVRNFDGLLLKSWEDLGEGQAAIANAIRNVVGNAEEANMIVNAIGGDLATAERVYRDFLKGSVVAEQWKPRLGEIRPILDVMKQVGVVDETAPLNSDNVRRSLRREDEIPEQANAFPDRNYPQDRSAMRTLGQISRERVAADPLTYESITPESFPVPDRIQDYLDLIEDEEDRKYGFDEAPDTDLSEEDKDMYQSIQGNKSGALQGFATPTQMFNNMVGKTGEQREFLRDRYERPMYETKKEYNANREQRWTALENMMKETGIQANTPESAAVQWYGEKVKPNEKGETVPYTLNDLKREFPNKWEDIVKMEQFMRGMYDEYVGRINAALEQVYPNLEEKAQAQLESWRNKIRVYQDEIEMSRNPVANEYWQNEIAKLDKKIAKLEGDLESGEYFRNKRLNPRQDYFHHFQEVETKGIGGLKNILQASTLIDPQLVGKTEFTKPKSRWMSWLQKRGQGAYTADAVLGMGKYIDSAEYAIAFDPLIAQYRDEISNMVKATRDTKNANQLIQYLSAYTNQLAGKTASLDRTVLDLLGEGNRGQLFNALAALNNRAKSNAVVGNVRSAVSQLFNIPNALSIIKSNTAWAKGARDYAESILGHNRELLDQSPFLQERYFDHNVDDLKARNTTKEKLIGKAGDVTNWMMEIGDKVATEIIWLSAYNEGIEKGVSDPIYYADDLTRQSVAGRGVGEVPYNMKSRVASFFMPFQVETNNQWQNMKSMFKDKDARGILRLMLGSYMMNALIAKPLFNDGVLPDVLDALIQGLKKLFDKDREESAGEVMLDTAKRTAGEAVSFIPGTSLWLPAIMSSDSAEALFGDSDPTRYGTGTVGLSTITKTLADAVDGDDQFDLMSPLLQLGLPYGGKQMSRLYNTLQDFNVLPSNGVMNTPFGGEKTPATGDYSKAGNLKYRLPDEVNSGQDAMEIARAFFFGPNATDAAQEYFESGKPALNKERVERYKEYSDVVDVDDYIQYLKEANTDGKSGISQAEAYRWLSQNEDLSDEEKNALWDMTSNSWKKSYDEYTPQNEKLVNEADEDGDGRVTQAEAYDWLSKQDDMSDAEKTVLWSQNGWKKAYDEYARSEQKKAAAAELGYDLKTLTEVADSDSSGSLRQSELYSWLQDQDLTDAEKSSLWDLGGWKTDYNAYNAKQKGSSSQTSSTSSTATSKGKSNLASSNTTTEKITYGTTKSNLSSSDDMTKPRNASGITNRKELLIAADSNNDGYMSQKEAYTYLSGTNLSEEEKEALWNLSNWKTSYTKYAKKNG